MINFYIGVGRLTDINILNQCLIAATNQYVCCNNNIYFENTIKLLEYFGANIDEKLITMDSEDYTIYEFFEFNNCVELLDYFDEIDNILDISDDLDSEDIYYKKYNI
jgi:hypothetical protein